MDLANVLEFSRFNYYTPLIVFASQLFALVSALRGKVDRDRVWLILFTYIIISVLLLLGSYWVHMNIDGLQSTRIFETMNICFEAVEVMIFTTYFYFILKRTRIVFFHLFLAFGFMVLVFIQAYQFNFLITDEARLATLSTYNAAIGLSIISFQCLSYYHQLFTDAPTKNLFSSSSFYITTSLFFYCITVIPFFLIAENLKTDYGPVYRIIYSLHYITFSLLFILIARSFLCRSTTIA